MTKLNRRLFLESSVALIGSCTMVEKALANDASQGVQKEELRSTADRKLRRKPRELTREQAIEVIEATPHAVLSTADLDGNPYGVPVSPVLEGDHIYFHSTGMPGGRKEDNMRMNPKVSPCYVAKATTLPEWYSVDFASAVVKGTASPVTDEKEKRHAMDLILARHAPQNSKIRNDVQFTNRYPLAAVWKVKIEDIQGKARGAAKWVKGKSIHEVQDMGPSKWLIGVPK